MENFIKLLKYLSFKTIYFNLKYFSLSEALKLPVFIHGNVKFYNMKGAVKVQAKIKTGMIKIGYDFVGIYDRRYCRAIWNNKGTIIFKGNADIKYGAKINVEENATLTLGEQFRISCNSSVVCGKQISFGKFCRISWESIIIDTDFHKVYSQLDDTLLNPSAPIVIGDNVWIGMHCRVLKGSEIGNNCIVAANSLVNAVVQGQNQVVAGQPVKVVRSDIYWTD